MSASDTGFDALIRSLSQAPDRLERKTLITARRLAEKVAGKARAGAPVNEGRLRSSIQGYVEVRGTEIEGGAKTSYPPAIYHEFGTGPVGEASGYPGKELASGPIAYRPDGWTYWSDEAAAEREPQKNGQPNGFVFTRGVPAKAFMYNALAGTGDEIVAALGEAALEVFADK